MRVAYLEGSSPARKATAALALASEVNWDRTHYFSFLQLRNSNRKLLPSVGVRACQPQRAARCCASLSCHLNADEETLCVRNKHCIQEEELRRT